MRDKISIRRVALLHPKVRDEVARLIGVAETLFPTTIAIRVVQGMRTIAEQDALYAQGRSRPGKIVTNARGGKSYHNYGLAWDMALLYDKDGNGVYEELSWDMAKDFDLDGMPDWLEVVQVFTAAGWTWGADWDRDGKTKAQGDKDEHLVDGPHLQKTFGYTVSQLFTKYKAKFFIPGTQYAQL